MEELGLNGERPSGEIACTVVYLSRGVDGGLASFRRFLRSYDAHPAGAAHELVVAAKGWEGIEGFAELEATAAARGWRVLQLPDDGFDFAAYHRAAALAGSEWIGFLNTHSEILAPNWLGHLWSAAAAPGVGAAGATASWGTFAPTPAHDRFAMRRQRRDMAFPAYLARTALRAAILRPWRKWLIWRDWPAFPNAHLRSNAFVARRADFIAFADGFAPPAVKKDAFAMESGRRGFTRFLAAKGLSVVVVDRTGAAWRAEDWPRSRTFRTPDHGGLLIADNQTRAYAAAAPALRQIMEVSAWGEEYTRDDGGAVGLDLPRANL